MIKKFKQFVLEDFADDYPKNEWSDIADTKDKYDEITELVRNAYKNVPGGSLEDPESIKKDPRVDYWRAIDMDDDPECDAVLFGKHSRYGIKLTGLGQDGTKPAKTEVIATMLADLKNNGYYCEISGNLVTALKDVPYVNDPEEVAEVLGKDIEWIGKMDGFEQDGWYSRMIHGHRKEKLLVGIPKKQRS